MGVMAVVGGEDAAAVEVVAGHRMHRLAMSLWTRLSSR